MTESGAERPKAGRRVVLTELSPGLSNGLPQKISEPSQKLLVDPVLLNEYDRDGRAELQFTDREGVTHFIYVNPSFMRTAE